ncbi:MAG: YggT family protein [Pseudanabaena sp. ELA607]|jgi:YggT family protein
MAIVLTTAYQFISIYLLILFVRVLLTWFPGIDWSRQPFEFLSQITDPYLNLFRSLLPPMGGIDFSAMLAFIVLSLAQKLLERFALVGAF